MEFVPLTKTIASFKIPNFTSGKYFHYHAPLTSAVALTQAPNIDLSATTSTPTFSIGVEPCYEISYCKLTKYTVDITVNKPYSSASLGDKGNTIRESYIHHFDASKKNVVVWEITITFLTNENVTSRLPVTRRVGCLTRRVSWIEHVGLKTDSMSQRADSPCRHCEMKP
uniref:Uncharacterized protein n=1 Tax=Lactuca sativa TaxID=4236 RepID=A0A9R1VEB9_LACSA|nr:hypothetical protein LSAT_V11C500282550 [Lactuca sativa]